MDRLPGQDVGLALIINHQSLVIRPERRRSGVNKKQTSGREVCQKIVRSDNPLIVQNDTLSGIGTWNAFVLVAEASSGRSLRLSG
jgi:hypothetical protein